MKTLFLLVVTLSLGLFYHPVQAETTDNSWSIEQRCLPAATTPPKGWTFDGTILLTGNYGIHGVRTDWITPHVLVFLNDSFDLSGGALSPDSKWYASPYGHREVTDTENHLTSVDEIRVFSTINDQIYHIALKTLFAGGQSSQIVWLDNTDFLYATSGMLGEGSGIFQINLFTQKITRWQPADTLGENDQNMQFLSPDRSLIVYNNSIFEHQSWKLYSMESSQALQNLPIVPYILPGLAWAADSTQFAVDTLSDPDDFYSTHQLVLYNRDGEQKSILMRLDKYASIDPRSIAWSDDDQYLAFMPSEYQEGPLYIADFQQHKIIDTCISINANMIWLPASHKLVFVQSKPNVSQFPVIIADLDNNSAYVVAYQQGHVLGWRSD